MLLILLFNQVLGFFSLYYFCFVCCAADSPSRSVTTPPRKTTHPYEHVVLDGNGFSMRPNQDESPQTKPQNNVISMQDVQALLGNQRRN